ncbi:pentapeptide repeat-containing protein [Falsiroseomonas sp. E2-1-a4]|uniref:pentapeptide repeat-containing protein n=1 Tax=Falsiroseomonas sp. E2-1-a4 TaxID=3239299 RepID=UPI003F2E6703
MPNDNPDPQRLPPGLPHIREGLDEAALEVALLAAEAAAAQGRLDPEAELKALGDAANEAAKREAAQWFFFVTVMLTLAALIGSTTHRMMLLQEPVRVPLLSVELPLLGFYWAAPAIFVVLHFYLLAQVQLMAGKVRAFLDAAEASGDVAALRGRAWRLDPFSVAQALAAQRLDQRALAVRLMVWGSLAVAPLALLVFALLRFLPYHDQPLALWHCALIILDAALIVLLWPMRATDAPAAAIPARFTREWWAAVTAEPWIRCWPASRRAHLRPRGAARLASVAAIGATGLVVWLQPMVPLRLQGEVLIGSADLQALRADEAKALATIRRTIVLAGRDLRGADLTSVDLRRADLGGAQLQGATLLQAQLQGVSFGGAQLQGAVLGLAQLQGASFHRTQLEGASLAGAELQGAWLEEAQLTGASLGMAQLQGASLGGAQLQGASLDWAQLQGAWLDGAQLQGAWLDGAQLQGASLDGAQLQGAWLGGAQLQGASLDGAQLQGAWLGGAQLQGASLDGAQLEAASLDASRIWRLRAAGAEIAQTSLLELDERARPPCCEALENDREECARDRSWPDRTRSWVAVIPSGLYRTEAEGRLQVLVDAGEPEGVITASAWRARTPPDSAQLADRLGSLACEAEWAPHVARGILRQLGDRRDSLGPGRAELAARIAGPDCAGARGLSDDERADLARIAASQD